MDCQQCGARRPPSGPCPNCGAPPGVRSSRSDWRQQSGRGPAASRGGSGPGWRGSGPNWGGQGGAAGGWGYSPDDPAAGDPRYGERYRDPNDDYEEVELGRALVPSRAVMPPDFSVGVPGMPGVPGLPAEEEERLLGIRRPVYIPAAENRRRLRLGSWRVISGVLGIILVCVVSCGAASFFGKRYIDDATIKVATYAGSSNRIDYKNVPQTPVATPGGPGAQYISDVTTAARIYTDPTTHQDVPRDVTTHFLVNDTVYVLGQVRAAPQGQHEVCASWYLDGAYLAQLRRDHVCTSIDGTQGPSYSLKFQLPYPTPGVGMLRIYWDRQPAKWNDADPLGKDPALAQTIIFGVYEPPTPTAVPATPTKPAATPTKPVASPSATG